MGFSRVQPRAGTAAEWTAHNDVLRAGEVGYETDTGLRKYGDGSTPWSGLDYALDAASADTTVASLMTDPATATGTALGTIADDPASPMRQALAQVMVTRVNLADVPTPWIIPHKGGLALAPEHTDEAYRTSLAAGFRWVDMDLQPLADGSLANHHNTTVDAIMVETGNTTDFTTPEWLNLHIDAGVWFAPDWPDDLRPTLGRDVLRRYSTAAVYSIENKSAGYMQKTVDAVLAEGLQHSAILSSATYSDLAAAQAAGIATAHVTDAPNAAVMLAAGTQYAVISATVADSVITNAVAAGLKVICWNVARRSDYARVVGLGAVGVYADDPTWISGGGESGRADWALQTWKAGQIVAVNSRGAFKGAGKWSPADSAGQNASSLLGPLCDSSPASSYTLQGSFFVDAKDGSSSPVIGLHFAGADDKPFVNNVSSGGYTGGYTIEVNAAGAMTLYRCDAPSTKTMIKNLGAAFTVVAGTECQVKVDVTPTDLTMTALNGADTTPQTVADSTYRGGFVHAFQAGLATAFYGSLKGWTRS